jgi:hypothetical protein
MDPGITGVCLCKDCLSIQPRSLGIAGPRIDMNYHMRWKSKGILDSFNKFLTCGGLKGLNRVGVCKVIRLKEEYWHFVVITITTK